MHQCVRRIIFLSFEFNQGCCLAISSSEGRNSEDVKKVINLEDGMPCSLALAHLYLANDRNLIVEGRERWFLLIS